MIGKNRRRAFLDKPRSARKKMTWHFLKLLGDQPYLTHDAGEEFYWIDFYFPSKKDPRGTFYNATLETSETKFEELCKDMAIEGASRILEPKFSLWNDPGSFNTELPLWEGLTRYKWIQKEQLRLAQDPSVYVCKETKCFKDYRYGVGLLADINVPIITPKDIVGFIERFWELGEPFYSEDPTPLSFPNSTFQLKVNTVKGFDLE